VAQQSPDTSNAVIGVDFLSVFSVPTAKCGAKNIL